jgi:hypothetical protein
VAANPEYLSNPYYSPRSESFVVRLVETIGGALEPTDAQLATLERSYNSTSEFLVQCPEFEGHLEGIHAQGSREMGTMTRPLRNKEGFDVDLVARLNRAAWKVYSGPGGATTLVNRLHSAVDRYAKQHNLKLHRWERCVTLEYADGMCADIAPVIDTPHATALHGELHGMIPDRELRTFLPTNPRGYSKLFNKIASIAPVFVRTDALTASADVRKTEVVPLPDTQVFGRLLCRLIQAMKLHRDIAFDSPALDGLEPSSVFITTLAAGSYQARAQQPHLDQLDLLLDVIRTMPTLIDRKPGVNGLVEWYVNNPTAPGDNLASSMNCPEKQQAFTQWHQKLLDDVRALIDSVEKRQGLDQVAALVTSTFGDRAGAALRHEQTSKQSAQRNAGRIATITATGISIPMTARAHTFFGD